MTQSSANNPRDWLVAGLAAIMCVACILWNISAPTRLGIAILLQQYMAFQLGLALTICYLSFDWRGDVKERLGVVDGLFAVIVFATLMYAAWDYIWMLKEQPYRPWQITVVGAVVTIAVMEGVRRRTGWLLFALVGIFLLYALVADKVPGRLIGKELSPVRLMHYVGFDPSAVLSIPLAVATVIVLLFVFFGNLLFAAGGGAFFTDLAMAATGRSRGGSAKVSVVASAMFGSISGSAVSNVVTTGVITIPLMQRGGYTKRDAGAIEAVASTGGQLTPPIMGAAAFLMAEFLQIDSFDVVVAAVLPALFYYLCLFMQVDAVAVREGLKGVPKAQLPAFWAVMRKGWGFVLPLAWIYHPEINLQDVSGAGLAASAAQIAALIVAVVGATAAHIGYFVSRISIVERIVLIAGAAAILYPAPLVEGAGCLAVLAVLGLSLLRKRRVA